MKYYESSIHFPHVFFVSFNCQLCRGARCAGYPRDQPLGPSPNTGECGAPAAQLAASADHSIGRSPGRVQDLENLGDQRVECGKPNRKLPVPNYHLAMGFINLYNIPLICGNIGGGLTLGSPH